MRRTDDDDDDVYYYIRWRLELEGETENTGVCMGFSLETSLQETPNRSRKKMVPKWLTGTIFLVNLRPS